MTLTADDLCAQARAHEAAGDDRAAQASYLAALAVDQAHYDSLLALGSLLVRTGYRSAAGTAFSAAVSVHPERAHGHACLGAWLADEERTEEAVASLQRALTLEPKLIAAHQVLAVLALRTGNLEAATEHGRIGYGNRVERWPYRGNGKPVRVLVLYSALGGNVGIERFFDDRIFAKHTLVAEFFAPGAPLPAHDVVFNAIGDPDRCRQALENACAILRFTSAPVLNPPERVLASRRIENAERLGRLPNIRTAYTEVWSKERLSAPNVIDELARAGYAWPLLVRSPGFHTGQNFEIVAEPIELARTIARLPGDELLVMEFLDVRDADGYVRKYRAMCIDGRLYPLHVAISRDWKVHFATADMESHAEHRAADAQFLNDLEGTLGSTAFDTLKQVAQALALDYGGIDFSVASDGRIVIFEANATMVVPQPDADPRWDYRRAQVTRIHDAARAMIMRRANTNSHAASDKNYIVDTNPPGSL